MVSNLYKSASAIIRGSPLGIQSNPDELQISKAIKQKMNVYSNAIQRQPIKQKTNVRVCDTTLNLCTIYEFVSFAFCYFPR